MIINTTTNDPSLAHVAPEFLDDGSNVEVLQVPHHRLFGSSSFLHVELLMTINNRSAGRHRAQVNTINKNTVWLLASRVTHKWVDIISRATRRGTFRNGRRSGRGQLEGGAILMYKLQDVQVKDHLRHQHSGHQKLGH